MSMSATRNLRRPITTRETAPASDTRFTIGKLAKLAQVSVDTLRFYEGQGLLEPTAKTGAGYRLYGEEAVRHLAFISTPGSAA